MHLVNFLYHHNDFVPCLHTEGKGCGLIARSDSKHVLEVFSDSDWSGNKATRKSTSAGYVMLDGMLLHSSSRSQACVALSSAEAEYVSCVSACCDSILLRSAIEHLLQEEIEVHLFTDSSAARGIITRRGCGKLRHVAGRLLWLQDFVNRFHRAALHPVGTDFNVADLGTKIVVTTSHIVLVPHAWDQEYRRWV